MQTPKNQVGGMYNTIFLIAVFAASALLAMRTIPIYINQNKVHSAVSAVAEAPQFAKASPAQIQDALQRRWDVDDTQYLEIKNIKIDRTKLGGRALSYKYEVRQTLFANWDLVITFEKLYPMFSSG